MGIGRKIQIPTEDDNSIKCLLEKIFDRYRMMNKIIRIPGIMAHQAITPLIIYSSSHPFHTPLNNIINLNTLSNYSYTGSGQVKFFSTGTKQITPILFTLALTEKRT